MMFGGECDPDNPNYREGNENCQQEVIGGEHDYEWRNETQQPLLGGECDPDNPRYRADNEAC